MKRPFIFILLYAIAGIILSVYFDKIENINIILCIIPLSISFLIFYYKNFSCLIYVFIFIFYLIIGLHYDYSTKPPIVNDEILNNPSSIEATVIDKAAVYDDTIQYIVNSKKIINLDTKYTVDVNMYLYTKEKLSIGDIISFNTKLRLPSPKRNDSDNNQIFAYKAKNIQYKLYPKELKIIGKDNTIPLYFNNISNKIRDKIYLIYPQKEAGIITAMVLGDKSYIDADIYDLYRLSGIVHIIAISGLHISILAGIMLAILKPLLGNKLSKIAVMIFLFIYCVFTGCSVSVLRAVIMMYIFILSGFLGRKYDLLSSASTACCLLLAYNPYYLFNLGFQYSFTAVFAIGFTSDVLDKYNIKNKFLSAFTVSFVVTLATKPITAHYFYYINTLDLFVNIIAISLMEIIILFALIAVPFSFINVGIAKVFAIPSIIALKVIEKSAILSLNIPFSQIQVGFFALVFVLFFYIFLLSVYNVLMEKKYCVFTVTFSLVILISNFVLNYDDFEAEFMYIGQGDCSIIKDNGKCYLMDAGSNTFSPTGSKIIKQLKYENIHKIDGIYISHMDYDHMGAILEMADNIKINRIMVSKYCDKNDNYKNLLKTAYKNNIEVMYVDNSYSENLTNGLNIKMVFVDEYADNTNDSSAVYMVTYDNKKILFTGDIGTDTEFKMLDKEIDADIIKVPHHGSKNSAMREFVNKVSPYIAINFAGYNNVYNHPSPYTVKMYNDLKIPFLSTNYYGMIKIRIDKNDIYCKLIDTKFTPVENIS